MTLIERIDAMRKALDEGRIAAFAKPELVAEHGCFYDYRHYGHPNLGCAIGTTLSQEVRDELDEEGMLGSYVGSIGDYLGENSKGLRILKIYQGLHDDYCLNIADIDFSGTSFGEKLRSRLVERFGWDAEITKEVFAAALEIGREIILSTTEKKESA